MTEYTYRKLDKENVGVFVEYLWTLRDEFKELEDIIPADKDTVAARLGETLGSDTGICIIATEAHTGNPVGFIILSIYQTWWTKEDMITNVGWYVAPNHRRSTVAKTLLGLAKAFSIETNKPLYLELLSGPETTWPVLERYIAMSGLRKHGSVFFFSPNKDNPALNLKNGV